MPPILPHSHARFRAICAAALAAMFLTVSAHAGVRYSIALDVTKGQTAIERTGVGGDNNNNNNNNGGGGGGGGGRGGRNNTSSQDIFYNINLRNNDKADLPNVTIEYCVYNRTVVNSSQNGRTVTMDEIKGTETIELPGNTKKTVQTQRVSNNDSRPAARRPGTRTNANQDRVSTTQDVDGWWVIVKVGDQVVGFKESESGYKKKIEAEMAKQQQQ